MLSRLQLSLAVATTLALVAGCSADDDDNTQGTTVGDVNATERPLGMSSGCPDSDPACGDQGLRCPSPASVCIGATPDDCGEDCDNTDTPETPPVDPCEELAALEVEMCDVEVCSGALDRDIVRRIIRAHLEELRHCYGVGVCANPALEGRAVLQLMVDGDGLVPWATVQSSTLGSVEVERCVVQAARRWEFPKPRGGGQVFASAPLLLTRA